ncbi:outer membrane lipoprotein carrier protein LolA [uncultured Desulfobacter sp.]|uniref:LolA family protein n=1 Tax=uncultured Desulfobacter sp. TaxID=240139 RepID=UPI002AAAD6D9|nr:outer membrane lipoprotein carrier protein LolA [uncultured Desulfobacter sp.]
MKFRFNRFLYCLAVIVFSAILSFPGFCAEAGNAEGTSSVIPEGELRTILTRIEENMNQITSLKTKIIQEKKISLFSEPVFSNGILLFKSPDKIRLEYFDPFRSVLLVSKDKIYKYEMVNGKWENLGSGDEKMMRVILDHIASWIKGRFNEKKLYSVSGRYRMVENRTAYCILLEPKAEGFKSFISGFELGINENMTRLDHIIIKEPNGDYTKLMFHDDQINTGIQDLYFTGNSQNFSAVPQW